MEKLEYKNNFGLLFEYHFCVLQFGVMKKYSYQNFRKIRLLKTRNYQFNLVLLLCSIGIMVLGFSLRSFEPLFIVFLFFVCLAMLYGSYQTKKYRYQLQMVTLNYEPIVIDVDSEIHGDANKIVRKLNFKLNGQPTYLTAV